MKPQAVDSISFGYRSVLKRNYLQGLIPLKRDITGRPLKKEYASLDHTFPKVKGGKSELNNYTIMDSYINNKRGAKPLKPFIDIEAFVEYLLVMLTVKTPDIDGVDYVIGLLKNILKDFKENKDDRVVRQR